MRAAAVAIIRRVATGENTKADRIAFLVRDRLGAVGIGYLLLVLAEQITDHAPAEVRNVLSKVCPELALIGEEFDSIARRARSFVPHAPCRRPPTDRAVISAYVADYLSAVQRQDMGAMAQVMRRIESGNVADWAVTYEIILALAAMYSPAST
ncbi:hypothetical protein NGB36_03650 [Streptomyces sp. RB6PN25]|uniref:Uncharacterized protein n=1 Tax=Streptomyces humicola TaxID=2953240 RepID=A0ABT1PPV6_9ACTN|nr:hypothetical protein [Streptomyces humicola]MCQ4079711.1 hypothetical protein [Streptomyces humicola]